MVANLTRYKPDLKEHRLGLQVCMVKRKRGKYVKFEEAVEASSNSLQQLKAKIAASLDDCEISPMGGHYILTLSNYERMRQLSAV